MPEVRKTSDGKSVCRFRLAVRRTYKTDGEYKTDFFDFVAWDRTAELIGRYYGQGQLIAVKSEARLRSYENKRGDRIIAVEFWVNEVESLVQRTSKEEVSEQGNGVTDATLPTPSVTHSRTSLSEGGYIGGGNEQDGFIDIGSDEDLPF